MGFIILALFIAAHSLILNYRLNRLAEWLEQETLDRGISTRDFKLMLENAENEPNEELKALFRNNKNEN